MVVSREEGRVVSLVIDGQKGERASSFKYLGAIVTENGNCIAEVKARIAMAKTAFNKISELLSKGLKKELMKRMVKALVWPVVLYGCETWTIRKDVVNKFKAFEMWAWRRMEKVSWKDNKTNEEILISVGEERSFVQTVT